MQRNSLLEMSGRVMHQAMRFTLNQGNDNPMMQELHLDGMNSEGRSAVERVQAFGFTSTPLPRDKQQGQDGEQGGGGDGGTGGDGEQNKGPAAEGICLFLGGQRNHPVFIAIDDRRHRPMGLKPGENAQYDHNGQMTLLRSTGTYVLSLDDEQQSSGSSGSARDASGGGGGQQQTRMASLRHVQKKKQQRPGQQGGGGGGGGSGASAGTLAASGGSSSGQSQQDYKHEGEQVNHEVRVTKGKIEFYSGDTVVGYYDKQNSRWSFTGEVRLGSDSASHPVYGVNSGKGMTTQASGSGAVLVNAPNPGPPTSEDTETLVSRIAALESRVAELEARNGR
jgi:phage gp45-like